MKKILLGVTGGIAAYKSAEIIRLLRRSNVEVKVAMTQSALEFVQPLTFSTFSNNLVYTKMFEQDKPTYCEPIELAQWADDIFIATAAVSDYRAKTIANQKIKRENNETLTLSLIKNPDILSEVAGLDHSPLTVGFAAETENLESQATKKLHQKNIDIIAANLVGKDQGFSQDENALILIAKNGEKLKLGKKSKTLLADELIKFIS